jgi:hypothetical protein
VRPKPTEVTEVGQRVTKKVDTKRRQQRGRRRGHAFTLSSDGSCNRTAKTSLNIVVYY